MRSRPGPAKTDLVLVVEDADGEARLIAACLAGQPFELRYARTGQAALAELERDPPDAVLLDLGLPDMDGREVLRAMAAKAPATSVVILTGNASLDVAVESMRLGAFDYVVKPWDSARLVVTLRNAVERQRLRRLVTSYRERYEGDCFFGMIGASPAMRAVYRTIEAAAASRATIFICGESGTGKELCACAIHNISARREAPFVTLNCAAIPAGLIESEIFGHIKGAFTGAIAVRAGAVARADGGTFFMDEICEIPLELQGKLLRLVQTGAYQKLGGDRSEQADLRFVCATNRDPWREVETGRFREDLFYRMHVIPIEMPPLRDREGDVAILADHFLAEYSRDEGKSFTGFTPGAAAAIAAHGWPGNVRELQNVIRRIVVLNDGERATADMLPPLPAPGMAAARRSPSLAETVTFSAGARIFPARADPVRPDPVRPLSLVEEEAIERAVAACGGNVRRAAKLLGIDRATVYRKRGKVETSTQRVGSVRRAVARGVPVLDWGFLAALENALGLEVTRGLIERHASDMRVILGAVIRDGARREVAAARRQILDLKSLAAAFGMRRLQTIAGELERAWSGGGDAGSLLPELAQALDAALEALAEHYRVVIAKPA